MQNFSIAILAGGMSRRFGRDKSLAIIYGQPFYKLCFEKASRISDDVMLVAKDISKYPDLLGLKKVEDFSQEIQTPLMGIYSSLLNALYDKVFIWSVDAPLLKAEIIKTIVEKIEGYDASVPEISGKVHPLLACYKKDTAYRLHHFIENGNLKVMTFLEMIKTNYIDKSYFVCTDPQLISFSNINTEEDLLYLENKISIEK
ncbi:molybdenum cofactor guanylyltransferase [Calditerrivibrio nitroreducens]|uniref:Probable molybdenum cofactor guanylyltransferase n=1 Tax=Calditerrivibrio nitroreducens (strain DSM 19672 / NBRC 101217 / Yu37-1) TaxID=768670 RepID=E4TF87_CALNY|nr:molybdenum cofactor guanylyltransferase [Calditerrivibrio nitroreducens]ADR18426.1 molybdopterin-guanine dinucleotide biosynthesis protein A [Calditerrivibrio nitroreducens DSM 19672]